VKRHKQAKARTVAHHHKHVKPAHAHHKAAATGNHHKHHKAHKHHHVAKKHKGMVHRGLALGDAVACCAAEALAASLRLSGRPVDDSDVLALYWATASTPDEGASLLVTLEAAMASGLAGVKLRSFSPAADLASGAILGVDLPGPHTVLATPEGWWSWGELHCPWCDFPDAVIEEAWEVTWL